MNQHYLRFQVAIKIEKCGVYVHMHVMYSNINGLAFGELFNRTFWNTKSETFIKELTTIEL